MSETPNHENAEPRPDPRVTSRAESSAIAAEQARKAVTVNLWVGVVFVAAGIAVVLTVENWVIGMPFVILGLSFVWTAQSAREKAKSGR
ncbi:hypothetical protein [Marisediminicola sp. LYQ85]|uniref:hypothetical protein n=1 Tax=Marisediminicola sp. LYQ85 TaxID=3391062 RepID=UPI0039831673